MPDPVIACADFSMFDAHQDRELRKAVDVKFMQHMCDRLMEAYPEHYNDLKITR